MASMHCPSCGSDYLRRSQRRTRREHLFGLTGLRPFLCEDCGHRFLARPGKRPDNPKDENNGAPATGRRRFLLWGAAALAGALLIIGAWLIISYLKDTTPKAGPGADRGRPALTTTTTILMTTTTQTTTPATSQTTTQTTATTTVPLPTVTSTTLPRPAPLQTPPAKVKVDKKPSRPPAQAPSGGKSYSVQFGAFKGPIRAEALRRTLAQKGLAARVDKASEASGEVLYKVRVGFYPRKSQALAEQKKLKQTTGMECFVARVRQP